MLEERYFSDPSIYREVRRNEDELIREYLDNRLPENERERFERRYLTVPELTRRLEAMRSGKRVAGVVRMRWAFATAVVLPMAIGFVVLWPGNRGERAHARQSVATAILNVPLFPGVAKGGAAETTQFAVPALGRVRLSMELPGRAGQIDCKATLSLLDSEGHLRKVWESGTLHSTPSGTSQTVVAEPNVSALRPGDYIAETDSVSGEVLEKYVFRVNPSP